MTTKKTLFIFLLLSVISILAQEKKPNILVIMGDDIGWFNCSCYNEGLMGYKTPNIDRLATEGERFNTWYAQQSCTAGRSAFVTGQSPIRTGLTKVGMPGVDVGLSQEDPSIAEFLKALGYSTGQFGKNHLKPDEICEESLSQTLSKGEGFSEEIIISEETKTAKPDISLITETEKPLLLIVEDNPDVREYISMVLGNEYRIFEAKDGEEGLEKSFEHIPDLIISDIMMPKLDGFQMCSKLKTDSRTSHIPIIMLTAKATMNDKISGLEIGADEYIMKPFEAEELKARIKNLLEQRKRLHEHFRKYGLVEIEEKNITPVDQKFLQKALAIINEHISDTSFGVETMADDMAVSRSLLLKKINALVGEPPSELIKRTRLSKAAKLIENNSGNISKIALEVGLSNPSYFAEAFKKQFGVPPTQYHQNNKTS
jgi:DNA-binding response OmpR family regulator